MWPMMPITNSFFCYFYQAFMRSRASSVKSVSSQSVSSATTSSVYVIQCCLVIVAILLKNFPKLLLWLWFFISRQRMYDCFYRILKTFRQNYSFQNVCNLMIFCFFNHFLYLSSLNVKAVYQILIQMFTCLAVVAAPDIYTLRIRDSLTHSEL